jgi:hypothetical protein
MALRYSTSKLNFVEVDVHNFDSLARLHKVNSGVNGQLPTLILFEDGRESVRFPPQDDKADFSQVLNYKEKELIKYFDLDKRHLATRDIDVVKKRAAT